MKGIVTLYVNFPNGENKEMIQNHLTMVRDINKDIFAKIEKDYHIIFVPTTGESSRFEKTLFELPN